MTPIGSFLRLFVLPFSLLTLTFAQVTADPASGQGVTEISAAEIDATPGNPGGACRIRYVAPPMETAASGNPATVTVEAGGILHVEGHSSNMIDGVRIQQSGRSFEAEFVTIDDATEIYQAEGNIRIREDGLLLTGNTASGNLFSGDAAIDAATFLLHQNRLRGSAARVSRSPDNRLTITDGRFTTCDPDDNTWLLEGDEIELITEEGYGTARDVRLRVKDIPVAWFPYLRFPIDESRQSGFLLPSVGQDSDGGTDISIPYYFNLAPNYDLTYSLRSIWKRGIANELEFRHMDARSENLVTGAYLPDDDEYDPRDNVDLGAADPFDFEEQDRWLAHVKHRGVYGRWVSRINYTAVSDIDYLRDLGSPTSTDTDFNRVVGSTQSPALLRTGSLDYRRGNFTTAVELRSFQKLSQIQTEQYETLPRVTLAYRTNVAAFDVTGSVQATQFDRNSDVPNFEPVTGARYVFDGSVSVPMRNIWGFLVPRADLIHRSYDLDDTTALARDDAEITTGRFSIDSGLIFERTTSFLGRSVLQTLEPRLFYLYAEEDFQDDLPRFDTSSITPSYNQMFRVNRFTGYDRIGDANQLSIGVSSNISALDNGAHMMTLGIGQIVHFEDREVVIAEPGVDPEAGTSPFFITANVNFSSALNTRMTYEWDPDESRANRGFFSLKYRPANNAIFNLSYAYTNEEVHRPGQFQNEKESNVSFIWPLGRSWHLIGRWNYGYDDNQSIESVFGVEYNDCCWKTRLVYRRFLEEPRLIAVTDPTGGVNRVFDRRADSGLFLEIQLKGLGSLGGRLDSLLSDTIPGYRPE